MAKQNKISDDIKAFRAARNIGESILTAPERVTGAWYDADRDALFFVLVSGEFIGMPVSRIPQLSNAPRSSLTQLAVDDLGISLRVEGLDIDLNLPNLLGKRVGSSSWLSDIGRKGGAVATEAKAAAARTNGAKGGRPRKLKGASDVNAQSASVSIRESPLIKSQDARTYSRKESDGLDRRKPRFDAGCGITVRYDVAIDTLVKWDVTSASASILPRNFMIADSADDFVFEEMTPTIQKLGRRVGLTLRVPGPDRYRSIHEKDAQVIAPVLVFAHSFLIEGGAALTVAFLEHFGRFVASQWGPKISRERDAHLEIIITHGKRAKSVQYTGPIDGLATIIEVAREPFDD